MLRFKEMPMHPSQTLLFPQSVEDALAKDCDVRAFKDVMDCIDYSVIEYKCSATGCPPYPPRVMVNILGYAYSKGLRSSRRIEELVNVDVRFIWLAGGLRPDHNTIARFRKDNWSELSELYKDSVRISAEAGLVFLNATSTDGSKIPAVASKKRVYSQSRLDREMAVVDRILQEAEDADRAEDEQHGSASGSEIPEHLKDAAQRKARLQEISKRLSESKKAAVVESEPDARVMLTRNGKAPAYNLQASVDAENQIIVAMSLTQAETDHGLLPEMVRQVEENTGLSPDVELVDSGYSDEETIKFCHETGQDVLMPIQDHVDVERNDLFSKRCFIIDEQRDVVVCPAGRDLEYKRTTKQDSGTYRVYAAKGCKNCSFQMDCVGTTKCSKQVKINQIEPLREELRQKFRCPESKEVYALRKQTVETVFAQIKKNLRFDRLLLRGFKGASAEIALICMVHNVLKCARSAARAA
jgi:transposase